MRLELGGIRYYNDLACGASQSLLLDGGAGSIELSLFAPANQGLTDLIERAMLGFLLAGFALAGSPGPNTLSLVATGAAFGARRGLAYLVGLSIGMVAVMGITATGVIGIVLALPGAMPAVTVVAGLYFVYLAFRIATAPPLSEISEARRQPSLMAGVAQSLVNPKAYAAMAALFSGFVLVRDELALDFAAKVVVATIIIIIVNVAWLIGGAAMTRWFRDPMANRLINVSFAVLLLVSVSAALFFS